MTATGPRPTITPGEHVSARPGAFVVSTAFESTKCSVVGLATLHCTWETTPDPQPQAFHSTSAYHSNQQYSVYTLTNASGAVSERIAYTAYGQPTFLNATGTVQTTSANNNRYTYTGREWDATIGLHHFRARWMSPMGGRFLGRDPIGYFDSMGLYVFIGSHALNFVDSTGLAKKPCRVELKGRRGELLYLEPFVQPSEDPYNVTNRWTPIATSYNIYTDSFQSQFCGNCYYDIDIDSRAQRYYRFNGKIHVDYRGVQIGNQNDPRNFASLLKIKVCFTPICCDKMEPFEEEHEFLFYQDGLGTYIQYSNADGPRGIREARDSFVPPNPACTVGSDFLYHIRQKTLPGDGIVQPR